MVLLKKFQGEQWDCLPPPVYKNGEDSTKKLKNYDLIHKTMISFFRFAQELAMKVSQLSPHSDISFKQSTDGSGKGAALVTAVTCRLMNQEELRTHGMP